MIKDPHPGPDSTPTPTLRELIARRETSDELRRVIRKELRSSHFIRERDGEPESDIFQETVLKALRNVSTYDPARGGMGWLVMIARNTAREYWRKRLGRRERTGDEVVFEGLPDKRAADHREDVEAIAAAMGRLDPKDRRVIELYHFCGLTGAGLASALGLPTAGAGRIRLHRAMEKLKAIMAAAPPGPSRKHQFRRTAGRAARGVG